MSHSHFTPESADLLDVLARAEALLYRDAAVWRSYLPDDPLAWMRAIIAADQVVASLIRRADDPNALLRELAMEIDVDSATWGVDQVDNPAPPSSHTHPDSNDDQETDQ